MAVMTTIGIIAGITVVVCGLVAGGTYYATEEERAQANINKINNSIANCNTIIDRFNEIKIKLNSAKDYLNAGNTDFINGGLILPGATYAEEEFDDCLNKINTAVNNIDSIISDYNSKISELKTLTFLAL